MLENLWSDVYNPSERPVHAVQDASGGLLIVDRVVIPAGIPPGEYVLGWRAFHYCLFYYSNSMLGVPPR